MRPNATSLQEVLHPDHRAKIGPYAFLLPQQGSATVFLRPRDGRGIAKLELLTNGDHEDADFARFGLPRDLACARARLLVQEVADIPNAGDCQSEWSDATT